MSVGHIMSTPGVFSTLGDTMMSVERYHEYTGECSVHWGFHTNSIVFPMTFPTFIMISPGVLMNTPSVLMISPTVLMISPSVLNIPRCTAHPLVYCTDIMLGEKYIQRRCICIKRIITLHNVCAVHRRVCRATRDVQYTGGYHEYSGGYHE